MGKEINICPFCGGEVLKTAQKCKHCGEWINYNCPICGEFIPRNSHICPECKTILKKENKNNKENIFRILAIISLVYMFIVNSIFSIIGLSSHLDIANPEEADMMNVISIIYAFLTFIPFYVPIISLIVGFERKISALATIINIVGEVIFCICILAYSFANI